MQKAQDFGIQCIKFGLQADERYRLHEFLSEGLYMLIAAGLKAAVAFNETPRYAGNTACGSEQMIAGTSSNNTKHARHRSEPIDTQTNTSTTNKRFGLQQQQKPSQRPTASFSASTTSSATCSPQSAQKTRTSWIWPWWASYIVKLLYHCTHTIMNVSPPLYSFLYQTIKYTSFSVNNTLVTLNTFIDISFLIYPNYLFFHINIIPFSVI